MRRHPLWERWICYVLAMLILLTSVPMPLLQAAEEQSGTCGTNVTWHFADGTLTISGTGSMTSYTSSGSVPWYSLKNEITSVVIEEGVTSVGQYAFSGCSALASVTLPETLTRIDSSAFASCGSLTHIKIPDSVKSVSSLVFHQCNALTSAEVGKGVTSIGSAFWQNKSLETVLWNAANCKTIDANLFIYSKNVNTVVIGPDVDVLSAKFWSVFGIAKELVFQGPNYFSIGALVTENTFENIPIDLPAGDYYADINGALYRLENDTAALVYCPPGIETLTVPAQLEAIEDVGPYTVISVERYAFFCADALTAITFESPEKIIELEPLAMAYCPTLKTVNGTTSATEAKALFSNATIGVNVFHNTGFTDGGTDGHLQQEAITVTTPQGPDLTLEIFGDSFYTGQTCQNTINISNNDTSEQGHVVRVYFQFSDEDGTLSYAVGEHNIKSDNSEYTIQVCESACDNIYYIDIPQPTPGDTVSLNVNASYPSPTSDGGDMLVWGAILSPEEAETLGNGIVSPEYYHQATWQTRRDTFPITKRVSDTPYLKGDGTQGGNVYVTNLRYAINMKREGDTLEGVGKDYMQTVVYEDILTLPTNSTWRDGVLDAIRKGQYTIVPGTNYIHYYVTLGEEKVELCELYHSFARDLECEYMLGLTEDGENIALKWKFTNPSATKQEMPLGSITLTYGSEVICITDPELQSGNIYEGFTNTVNVTQHFIHTGDVVQEAKADNSVTAGEAAFQINKRTGSPYNSVLGNSYPFVLRLTNDTALPYENLTRVEDPMPNLLYLSPAGMQSMFDADQKDTEATLSIRIKNATLCQQSPAETVTGTDGQEYIVENATTGVNTQYNGLETEDSVSTEYADLVLTWTEDGRLLQLMVEKADGSSGIYTIGDGGDYPTIADALTGLHYLVTNKTQFTPTWSFREDFKLWGGQKIEYDIPSLLKDSFMYTDVDQENYVYDGTTSFSNSGYAYYTVNGTETYKNYTIREYSVSRDFTLYKGASCNDVVLEEGEALKEGDVITYSVSLSHSGGGSYQALPMVDQLQGGQVLLLPAEGNAHLSEAPYGLTAESISDGLYYVLDTPGVYEKVLVGGLLADSVTVTKDNDIDGLNTLIRWYLAGTGNTNQALQYEALVAPDRAGSESVSYALDNQVWVGDHQSHRLWDTVGVSGSNIEFDKSIVTDVGETIPTDDVLTEYSPLKEGNTVLYRFRLHTVDGSSAVLGGADIYDILPASVQNFWDVSDIAVRYVAEDGTQPVVENGDHWYVTADSPDGTVQSDRQYLCWQDDFSMVIDGTAYIYVSLQCPEGEEWQNYAQAYNGIRLQNDLVVHKVTDSVYHDLAVPTEAILQKGVHETTFVPFNRTSPVAIHSSADSRWYYTNNDAYRQLVSYYVVLYNGGEGRLYLNDLQDVLPKGFTFYGMYDVNQLTTATSGKSCITPTYQFATVTDPEHTSRTWKSVNVTATMQMLDSGEQKLTFSLTEATTGGLQYDALLEKYYLAPGEGIQFAYACRTNNAADTEDVALNRVVMPYEDYNNAGVVVTDNVTIVAKAYNPKRNDGNCEVLDNGTAEQFGFTGGQTDTQWLSSDVTMQRGNIVPGITKAVESTKSYAEPTEVLNWKVSLTNDGAYSITDYTITDVMQYPYQFTGSVDYSITLNTTTAGFCVSSGLFQFVDRTDTTVSITNSQLSEPLTLTMGGEPVTLPVVVLAKYGTSSSSTNRMGTTVEVSIKKDADGNEVLTIRFLSSSLSIPGHGSAVLSVSTNNTTVHQNKMYYNTAYLTPNAQIYDESLVSRGNNTVLDGKPTVRNSCPVTVSLGYVTSSEKLVAQHDTPTNTASSNDATNYIVIPDKETLFDFTLQVENTTDKAMGRLILIDNLPEVGDHSTFAENDPRYSEFKVSLAEDPNFIVAVTDKAGIKTVLTSDQYRIEFSDKVVFTDEDWKGEGTDWFAVQSETTRSFRVVIEDTTGTAIPIGATVAVTFTAEIDGASKPGQVAWNSFGYHYNLLGLLAELEAAPLKVGVRLPSVPEIQKQLTLEDGTPFVAEKEETFRFLFYTGSAISLPDGYTEAELAEKLQNANRKFTYVELTVKQGETTSESQMLTDAVQYAFENGQWTATETTWSWTNGTTYTVMELPLAGEKFIQGTIGGSTLGSYSFTYKQAKKNSITCVNYRKSWKAVLHKTDAETGENLAGAIFGLYSPEETDKLSDEAYTALETQLGFGLRKTVKVGDVTYYLVEVQTSDAKGEITWTGLIRETYAVCELRAPNGYFISVDPQLLQFKDYDTTVAIEIPNTSYYALPSSGGKGILWYTIGGILVLVIGVLLCMVMKRKHPAESDRL